MIFGGHLKDIPEPHKRYFADKRRKRKVTVTISKWKGVGKHWYVTMIEEDDAIWDSRVTGMWSDKTKPNGWTRPWDRSESDGRVFSGSFEVYKKAGECVMEMVANHFPAETHRLVRAFTDEKWFYREGD